MTELRKFTEEGLREFRNILDNGRMSGNPNLELLEHLREAPDTTVPVGDEIAMPDATFGSRMDAAVHFDGLLENVTGISLQDRGLWAWLTLYYFDSVCPADESGKRKIGREERHIPDPAFRRYYRHLLSGPFNIYRAHRDAPERAFAVLCSPVDSPGDVVESLASRQDLITCPAVMEAATVLYVDNTTRRHKRGAARKTKGSARRFADVMMQLDLTYDLHQIPTERLLEMLPEEFDEFQPARQPGN